MPINSSAKFATQVTQSKSGWLSDIKAVLEEHSKSTNFYFIRTGGESSMHVCVINKYHKANLSKNLHFRGCYFILKKQLQLATLLP